jgi:Fe2+ transport system protein B
MFISILEESGYMSRVVLMDKIMRKFGLSGKVWCRLFLELPVLFLL